MSDNVPIPDPSVRTITGLEREVHHLKTLMEQHIEAVDQRVTEKLDADIRALYAEIHNRERAVELALDSAQKAVHVALESAQTAVDKAERSADKQFEAVNEFHKTLSDQTATFMAREVIEAEFNDLRGRLDRIQEIQNRDIGKDTGIQDSRDFQSRQTSKIIAALGVAATVVGLGITLVVILTSR